MVSLDVSGIVYECDGTVLRAFASGRAFGPVNVADAKILEDGSVYLMLGELHAVLSAEAFDILLGRSPAPTKLEPVEVSEVVAPTTRRSRRK